jgi:hypothetical protein
MNGRHSGEVDKAFRNGMIRVIGETQSDLLVYLECSVGEPVKCCRLKSEQRRTIQYTEQALNIKGQLLRPGTSVSQHEIQHDWTMTVNVLVSGG